MPSQKEVEKIFETILGGALENKGPKVLGEEEEPEVTKTIGNEPEIRIHIMSEGGDMFSGFTLKNVLEKSRVKVVTIAQGACCSAATFMFLGGSERRMGENAYLLIHQLSTDFWGKYQDLKNEMKSCDKFMEALKKMYMT